MDPKQVGVEVVPFEIANIAGEFDSALDALQAKCGLMEQIQAATEKDGPVSILAGLSDLLIALPAAHFSWGGGPLPESIWSSVFPAKQNPKFGQKLDKTRPGVQKSCPKTRPRVPKRYKTRGLRCGSKTRKFGQKIGQNKTRCPNFGASRSAGEGLQLSWMGCGEWHWWGCS